jgi:hypothetical protein
MDIKVTSNNNQSGPGLNDDIPVFMRGIFWMFVGIIVTCGGALWLFSDRYNYTSTQKPPGFYIAIGGFAVYVIGRVIQVIQKQKKKKSLL